MILTQSARFHFKIIITLNSRESLFDAFVPFFVQLAVLISLNLSLILFSIYLRGLMAMATVMADVSS